MSIEQDIKLEILDIALKKPCHVGGCLSCIEILKTLYFDIMHVDPKNPLNPNRDRFILSKGHAAYALYATLKKKGFNIGDICEMCHHPKLNPEIGIEATTGSLGHGLSIGLGMALASKLTKSPYRVYVLLGDGECQEGSVWEALMFAVQHGLGNVTAIVDVNGLQAIDRTEDVLSMYSIAQKWESFGWRAFVVNGHCTAELRSAFSKETGNIPKVIFANTIKGHGIPFAENKSIWHFRGFTKEEYDIASHEIIWEH